MSTRSNYTPTYKCPNTTTSDCVRYVGVDIPCLDVCNGDMLTAVENAIAVKLCSLVSATDISNLTIPICFTVAWVKKDKTILNALNFLLETACNQQNLITDLQTNSLTIDSLIEVNYPPCCTDECNLNVNLTISAHFEKILTCLCQQADRITELTSLVNDVLIPQINTISSKTDVAYNNASNWIANKPCVLSATSCTDVT